jgi:hypothetical protein
MDEINIWRLKALRLSVGLIILILWGGIFTLFQPMALTSGSMFDPATLEYEIDYVNMLICGAFSLLLGVFFLAITLSPAVRELVIEPAREQHYSARLFRFVGLILLALGGVWILYSVVKPF